jgi:hypothetical protein
MVMSMEMVKFVMQAVLPVLMRCWCRWRLQFPLGGGSRTLWSTLSRNRRRRWGLSPPLKKLWKNGIQFFSKTKVSLKRRSWNKAWGEWDQPRHDWPSGPCQGVSFIYVWPLVGSMCWWSSSLEIIVCQCFLIYLVYWRVIRLQRIYNFLCSMLVLW